MDKTRWLKKRLALFFLELWDIYSGGKVIDPETVAIPKGGTSDGGDLYVALISFMACFEKREWYYLQVLYRPDIKKDGSQARSLGRQLQPAWELVMEKADYFESAMRYYEKHFP